jgi:hypothetical protein
MEKIIAIKGKGFIEEILGVLAKVQARARTRRLEMDENHKVFDAIVEYPFGVFEADGGHIAASSAYVYTARTTEMMVSWYTHKGIKWARYRIERIYAKKGKTNLSTEKIILDDEDKAFALTLPKEYEAHRDRVLRNRIMELTGQNLPGEYRVHSIIEGNDLVMVDGTIDGKYGMCRVFVSPVGYIHLDSIFMQQQKSIWRVLRLLGFSLPRLIKDRRWNEAMAEHWQSLIKNKAEPDDVFGHSVYVTMWDVKKMEG